MEPTDGRFVQILQPSLGAFLALDPGVDGHAVEDHTTPHTAEADMPPETANEKLIAKRSRYGRPLAQPTEKPASTLSIVVDEELAEALAVLRVAFKLDGKSRAEVAAEALKQFAAAHAEPQPVDPE
jgi:hypothetical protein